jgi:hypothetical protein
MIIYLYVKRHSTTNLKYFGWTKRNPFLYKGSGTRWTKHIAKHGIEHVVTDEVWGFDTAEECQYFADTFSQLHDVARSVEWANLIPESGRTTVRSKTRIFTEEHKASLSAAMKGRVAHNKGSKLKQYQIDALTNSRLGKPRPESTKLKISGSLKGRPRSDETKAKIAATLRARAR